MLCVICLNLNYNSQEVLSELGASSPERAPPSDSSGRPPGAFSADRGIPEQKTVHEPRSPRRRREAGSLPHAVAATNKLLFIMYGGRMEQQQ